MSQMKFEPFAPKTIPFDQFLEKLKYMFVSNSVTEEKDKKALFLAKCSKEVFGEVKRLFPGIDLKTIPFSSLPSEGK